MGVVQPLVPLTSGGLRPERAGTRRTSALRLVTLVLASPLVMAGCGTGGSLQAEQPAGASEVASDDLGDLPVVPGAEPLDPRHVDRGGQQRRLRVPDMTPEKVMAFFEEALVGWTVTTPTSAIGPADFRASWTSGEDILVVTAGPAPELVAPSASDYTVTLRSRPRR